MVNSEDQKANSGCTGAGWG